MARGFLSGLFEQKSAVGAAPSDGRAVGRAVSQSPSRYGFYSSHNGLWDVDKAVKDGWERVLYVFRCVDAIATNQSRVPITESNFLKPHAKKGKRFKHNRVLMLLNTRPNTYETAAVFRYRLSTQALLSRKGAFIEIVGDPLNPDSLHLLPPQSVEPIPDPLTFVSGYRVRDAEMNETILKPEQVIWVRLKPHPTDPYAQTTPLVSAGIAAETDFLARLFNRNFLLADGRPGLLINVRGQINPDDAEELKRRFSGGPQQAGQTSVIEGDGLDVVDLGSTPRDAQWLEAAAASKQDIMLAFGVPESVLGNASGRTFDNADAEYELFWTHTMLPHCDAIAGAFDVFTGDLFDENKIVFDYSTVDVLHRQERARQDASIQRWLQGAINWNEMREDIGRETWDSLGARIIVLPSGFAMADNPEDQAAIMDLPNVNAIGMAAAPAEGGAGGPAQLEAAHQSLSEIARQGARLGAAEGARHLANSLAARALMLAQRKELPAPGNTEGDAAPFLLKADDIIDGQVVHPYETERKQLEARLDGLLISLSSRQSDVIADRLTHVKSRKGTRHWDTEGKAARQKPLDPSYAVETDRWVSDTVKDFRSVLTPVVRREAKRVMRDMVQHGYTGEQDVEAKVQAVVAEVLSVVERSARNQTTRIGQKIALYDEEGRDLSDIQQMVKDMIGTRSTWRKGLSGHTATAAYELIKHDVYADFPSMTKTWNTEDDERVRESHVFADGVTLKSHELFHVGGTMMRCPGDPLAPVEEVANCRCWLTYNPK